MVGRKIKYYRLKNGLTCDELSKRVGCTKAAISQYENNEREPNNETCLKIAEALNIPWIDLLTRDHRPLSFNHVSFKKKQIASQKDIEILKYEIETKCADRISLLSILGLINHRPFKPKTLSYEDTPYDNAKKIRALLGLPSSGPIYSITNLLEHLGIIVLSFDCVDEIDGVNGTVNGIPYVFFNSKDRTIEKQRFTIIHEVCHLFFNNAKTNMTEKEVEKYINQVAGNVLMPRDDIYSIFGKTNRTLTIYLRDQISKQYKIAPSCLITRLFEEAVITEIYYKKFFIFLNKNGGKKLEKTLLNSQNDSEKPTIFDQQVYLALGEELITASRAAEFLQVPLYDVMKNMRIE